MNRSIPFCAALLAVLLLAPVFSACTDAIGEPVAPANLSPHAVDHVAFGTPAAYLEATSEAQRLKDFEANVAVLHNTADTGTDYASLLRSEAPLADKDRAAETLLASYTGAEWNVVRQAVSAQLLELHLRNGSGDTEAIGRYTAALVEAENPSANLIAPALEQLRGTWSAEQIAAAARTSHAVASAWLTQHCAECMHPSRASVSAPAAAAGDHQARAIAASLDRLARLAR